MNGIERKLKKNRKGKTGMKKGKVRLSVPKGP